jgi:hypothetical protein
MDLFCCPTAGSAPFAMKFWLFSCTSSSWLASEDVQFQQVIIAAVFCRAMLEPKTCLLPSVMKSAVFVALMPIVDCGFVVLVSLM